MNNLLADAVTRIRNGYASDQVSVKLIHSKFVLSVIKILQSEGLLGEIQVEGEVIKHINVQLIYHSGQPALSLIKLLSKGSQELRVKYDEEFRRVTSERSLVILSTDKGIKTHYDARMEKLGGIVLLEAY